MQANVVLPNQERFLEEAKVAMGNLRSALLELVVGTGANLDHPQEISRRYKLDKTLTWKISRIVRDEEIASAVVHVPGRRRMASLLAAMRDGGASPQAVEGVWRAFDEFEKLVQVHSGDRGTLDVMVAGSSTRTPDRRLEALRKSGFQCGSAIWGVRARVHFGMHAICPSDKDGFLEAFTLCGFLGLERLRPGLPCPIADANAWDTQNEDGMMLTPLHSGGFTNGAPLMPAFCTQPVPGLRTVSVDHTNKRYELPEGAVGLGHAVDVVLGWHWPADMRMHEYQGDVIGEHGINISTPVELLILDLWVHRSLDFAMNPRVRVYSRLPSGPRYPHEGRETGLLPLPSNVIDLGFGAAAATMAEFPRNAELLQTAMDQRKWNFRDFRGFRYRLKYPPIPTLAFLQHPLLPPRA